MTQSPPEIRAFKPVFTAIGVIYVALAASALARGTAMLRDFGVPEALTREPVLGDFFYFFYQYMAWGGVLQVLFGRVVRGLRAQTLVAGAYSAANIFFMLRDLSTSDSRFGNRLYRGDATLMFVVVDLAVAAAFGAVAVAGLRRLRAGEGAAAPET
ncbi:MAG: hypothetical protein U0324_26910 [Polyangiales bacterium]